MMKVHAPVNGTIAEILVEFGESVKKGTPLIRITDPLIVNLQEEYLQSSLKLKLLESEYARQSTLSDQGINALKEYQKTETELELEKVRQKALYARLKAIQIDPELLHANQIQAGITLRSPGNGKIEFLQAEPGKYIQREEPLFEIIDPRQLYVEGFVFEKDIRRVKTGQLVRISSQNGSGEAPLMQGKVSSIGSRVDQENRTVKIRITLDKPTATDLITGMFVALGIETGSRLCYTVPEEAIVYDNDNRSWLFVLKEEGNGKTSYEVKAVDTGLVEDGYVELSKEDMERLQG
jgi:cobalt-zinc-cadmium efflux system membrane fusion protein